MRKNELFVERDQRAIVREVISISFDETEHFEGFGNSGRDV